MIALGTRVACSAKAFVARADKGVWRLPKRGNYYLPSTVGGEHSPLKINVSMSPIRYVELEHIEPLPEDARVTNKSVMVGRDILSSGVVIGLERKMIGESVSGGYSEDGGDIGYFNGRSMVDLYVVKSELRSIPFYVPEDAIVPEVMS